LCLADIEPVLQRAFAAGDAQAHSWALANQDVLAERQAELAEVRDGVAAQIQARRESAWREAGP
jgi:hypothetical protein